VSEDYDVTYPDDRGLCKELQRFADDCGKWGARDIQSLVARARARIIDLQAVLRNGVELADLDAAQSVVNQLTMELKREREKTERLEAELAKARERAAKGERLYRVLTESPDHPDVGKFGPYLYRSWANTFESEVGYESQHVALLRRIADALEVEERQGDSTADPDDLANEIILDDMEERGVIPPVEVPSEQEADAEQPCPHEKAEWDELPGWPGGWWEARRKFFYGAPGAACNACGKPLPPKPAELLTWEECWERLPEEGYFVQQSASGRYLAGGMTHTEYGDTPLGALRALVAAVEEAEDAD